MKLAWVVSVALCVPAVASADSLDATEMVDADRGAASVSLSVGGASYLHGGLSVDTSWRLGATPLFAHAQIDAGGTSEILTSYKGNYLGVHGGIEMRGCVDSRVLCAYMGIDAGALRESMREDEMTLVSTMFTLGPRAGVEIGNRTRLRFGFDSAIAPSEAGPLELTALQLSAGLVTSF